MTSQLADRLGTLAAPHGTYFLPVQVSLAAGQETLAELSDETAITRWDCEKPLLGAIDTIPGVREPPAEGLVGSHKAGVIRRNTLLQRLIIGAVMADYTTTTAGGAVAIEETGRLISSNKVVGSAVYNLRGERLGSIYGLMMDKYSGCVAYAVMSFGGFLGIGESYHPLPWRVLNYDPRLGGYVVDLDRERLEKAPRYTSSDLPDWADVSYGHRLDEYYGVPPYEY